MNQTGFGFETDAGFDFGGQAGFDFGSAAAGQHSRDRAERAKRHAEEEFQRRKRQREEEIREEARKRAEKEREEREKRRYSESGRARHTMTWESSHEALGVPVGADKKAIRSAWAKLCKECHPDLHGGDGEKLKRVNAAYETLKGGRR